MVCRITAAAPAMVAARSPFSRVADTAAMVSSASESRSPRSPASSTSSSAKHYRDVLLPDSSVDVVNSNCVINLSINKAAVFAETDRVLRPIGRLGGSDIVAENHLDPAPNEPGAAATSVRTARPRARERDGRTFPAR
jgi:hypothetical protein